MTYSTRTGQLLDSVPYGDYYYFDFRFRGDGKKAVYTGWPWDDFHTGAVWVTDYLTGDTISLRKGYRGQRLYLNDAESLVLSVDGPFCCKYQGCAGKVAVIPDSREYRSKKTSGLGLDYRKTRLEAYSIVT